MAGKRSFFLAVVLTLGAVLLMVATCGHRSPLLNRLGLGQLVAPTQESPPAVPDVPAHSGPLPGIWELDDLFGGAKSTRNGSQVVITGADYSEADSTTGRAESIEVEDTSLNLRAYEPGDFTYAVFGQLVGDGVMGGGRDDDIPLQSLFQTEPCDYGGGRDDDIPLFFYIGIADYTLGSWRWFGPFSDADPEVSLNNEELQNRFKSPSDMLYIAVLAAAGGKQISQLPREGLVAGLPFEPAGRTASQLEDPAGVRVKAIVTDTDSGIGTLPQAVTGLAASIEADRISLSWNPNPDPDVTSYEIYRKEAGIEGPPVWLDSVAAPATGYDDMSAEAGVTYLYGVEAVNDVGPGGMGYVSAGPPVIRGVSPTSGKEGALVKFVAIVSGSQPFTYAWDFGGGATPNTSTEARPTVTLGDAGEYNASVVVTNEYSSDTFDFRLIAQQSGGWHSVTVDGEGYRHYFSSIATVNGNPAISYCDATPEDGDLKYVRASDANGDSWGTPVTVDSEGVTGACTSLAIINGNPAIIYLSVLGVTEQSGDLKYIRATDGSGANWGTPQTVVSDGNVSWKGISLAVVNGNPAISYYDNSSGDLKYSRASDASGTTWGMPVTVDSAGDTGQYNSLVVVNGNPAISYYDATNNDLKYVRATDASGSAWGGPVTIDSGGVTVEDTCLVVVNGQPAISYWDESNQDLKYVRASDAQGSSWGSPITVGSAGADGGKGSNSLAVVNGNPAIICLYYQGTNWECDIVYVRATDANGDTWGIPVTVDSTSDNDGWTCLAVVNGNPAISYYDYTNGDLKYVRASDADGDSWGTPVTVDSEDNVGMHTSLAIVNGNPAISYCAYDVGWTSPDLRYVRATDAQGSSWGNPITVVSAGDVGYDTSLCVVNGNPAISYFDDTPNGHLKYVRATDVDGNSWGTPITVDSIAGNVGVGTSLCVVNGSPAISYYNRDNELRYVRATDANGASWGSPEILDNTGDAYSGSPRSSLVIANGNPAISYHDGTNGDLKYVRASDASGTAWNTPVTVDSEGDVYKTDTSLAIVNGYPSISYLDTNEGLKYVRASDANGSVWGSPVMLDGAGGSDSSLAEVSGHPAICYFSYDGTNGDLKYAYFAP